MINVIISEYSSLLDEKNNIELSLAKLPDGYISKKVIGGRTYSYLQARINGKVKSIYIKKYEVETTIQKINERKTSENRLANIEIRLKELEQAADLLDERIANRLEMLKLSSGMDELSKGMKQLCISFADAMTSVEGISPSNETKKDLNSWADGATSFLLVFESTLKKYGFATEVK